MKYLSPLALSFFLIGCQSTQPNDANISNNTNTYPEIETIATPADITEALYADETANVYHPVDDVDITLTKEPEFVVENDIWQHIRNKLSFPIPENSRVIAQRNWYAKHPRYLDRVAKRAEPFLHYIVTELEKHDMPIEMVLLPIVESAFDPFAYSHGRASGMWQFVPSTGKRFGMKQNWWYDGRRDVVASTQGAIDYLKYLHNMFKGDWLLALAAYNSGEGRVRRAVKNNARKGLGTDFWSLDLPKETRAYVPKLLALADLLARSEEFNIKIYEIANKPVVSKVPLKHQIDLAKAAELAGLSLAEFQRLNPGFNRWATDPDGPDYLLLPNDNIEQFKTGLANLTPEQLLSWTRYKIKQGDSLSTIAKKFDTRVDVVMQANKLKNNKIRAGKYLLIPVAAQSLDNYILSANQRLAKTQSKQRNGNKISYTIKQGDNLWDISRAHKVNYRSLAKWNGMAPTDPIKPGQKLVIWQNTASKTKTAKLANNSIMRNITYKVRRGDSLARIANKFQITIKDIERWNKLSRQNYLQPGQMLKLSVDVTNI